MLNWAVSLLVVALIAAVLGFGGVPGAATGITEILFVVFLVGSVVSLLVGRRRNQLTRSLRAPFESLAFRESAPRDETHPGRVPGRRTKGTS